MTVRINKQKINLREKLAGVEEKVNFDEVVRGLGEYSGHVGIGATSPNAVLPLTIEGAVSGIQFKDDDGPWNIVVNEDNFRIQQGTSGSNPTERMRIDSSGNVGIGTTNPNISQGAPGSTILTISASASDNTNKSSVLEFRGTRNSDDLVVSYIRSFNNSGTRPITDIQSIRGADDEGKLLFRTSDQDAMFIDSDGNVGIGTTNPGSYKLNVNGTAFFSDTITVDATDYTSDDRVKHNEQPIVGALETLSKITPKKYIKTKEMYEANHDFELDADGNPIDENGEPVEHRIEAGVIAQQVLTVDELAFAVSPEDVDEDGVVTSPHGLDYNSLFTYAIAAIQEQQQIIDQLKSRIETLEQQ